MALRENIGANRPPAIALLGAALAWCCALIFLRVKWTGSPYFLFLIWNLFLACVPFFASSLLLRAHQRRASDVTQLALVCIWLLFLPNAPYILTDLVHLRSESTPLYWYDLGMLLSCAGTGLVLGYSSLFDVHKAFEERFGARFGWIVAVVALIASGFGVYLGRVMRWNSWDVVTNPRGLFGSIADFVLNPTQHFHTYALSGLFGFGLLLGYAALHMMTSWRRPVAIEKS